MYCVFDEMHFTKGGVFLNSSTELQCTYTENVSQLPTRYLAVHARSRHYQSRLRLVVAASKKQKPIYFTITLPYHSTISRLYSTC